MSVWRFLSGLIWALVLIFLISCILFIGYAVVLSRVWERAALGDEVAEGGWMWIDGQPIYYRTWGTPGDTCIVLVHGLDVEGSRVWWDSAAEMARAGLWVVGIDLKGFGHSTRHIGDPSTAPTTAPSARDQATLLARALDQLQVARAVLVGHGWGSAVALELAQQQPERIERVVLVAPILDEAAVALWRPVAATPVIGPPLARMLAVVARVPYIGRGILWATASGGPLRTAFRRYGFYDGARLDRPLVRAMRAPTRIVGTLDALRAIALSSANGDLLVENLSAIKVPVLIVLGEQDPYVALAEGQRLAEILPDARVEVIPDSGHYPQLEHRARVSRIIVEFALQIAP